MSTIANLRSRSRILQESHAAARRLRRSVTRIVARIEFAARIGKRLAPLSHEQIRQFRRDGCLLVPGLIPEPVAREAQEAMWRCLGARAEAPESWGLLGPRPHLIRDERLVAAYTDLVMAAAAQLARDDMAAYRRPSYAFTINNPPVSGPWKPHRPHLDAAAPEERARTLPRPYAIGVIVYLTDTLPHGGGTIVYPGSHLQLAALARSDPRKYRYLATLNAEVENMDLGAGVEVTPPRGQVLFFDYLCAHASSDNVGSLPRLAMLHKW